jgi:hypothetical protein
MQWRGPVKVQSRPLPHAKEAVAPVAAVAGLSGDCTTLCATQRLYRSDAVTSTLPLVLRGWSLWQRSAALTTAPTASESALCSLFSRQCRC